MKKPKMILFDYGQTLVNEVSFDPLKGTQAVLDLAAHNPKGVSVDEIQQLASQLSQELRRTGANGDEAFPYELHIHQFQNYLYDYFDIQLTQSPEAVERLFTKASFVVEPTKNIETLLQFLREKEIRTGVISNISLSGVMLKALIHSCIPAHEFEFLIASSEVMFRKPNHRIFELALRKAGLDPSDVWYCGDHLVNDVDGASISGMVPVWYTGAVSPVGQTTPSVSCLVIEDWQDLITHIEGLEESL